jgi:transcriptional regulator with XRE-family HTH domain
VCQWENGDALPKADKLVAIAKLYGCTVEELLKEEESA